MWSHINIPELMSGIYIHIPFCKSRCAYCDFYSTTRPRQMASYTDALIREIEARKAETGSEKTRTIYIGGGTPSQMPANELKAIYGKLEHAFDLSQLEESTIECNPDDLTDSFLDNLSRLPINRISMGIQTFNDDILKLIYRRHTSEQAIQAVGRCRKHGFTNISIDLIYGLPGQTPEMFWDDIRTALSLEVTHISAYCLSYEEGTRLTAMRDRGVITPVSDEDCAEMFSILCHTMKEAGFMHYEISNFCRPGYHSRHNSSYWDGTPYIGLGAAAHSYDGRNRSWNISDIDQYMKGIEEGTPVMEKEELTQTDRRNEMVMLSLRTSKGLDTEEMASRFGKATTDRCIKNATRYIESGVMLFNGRILKLSETGIFVSDDVISSLFED